MNALIVNMYIAKSGNLSSALEISNELGSSFRNVRMAFFLLPNNKGRKTSLCWGQTITEGLDYYAVKASRADKEI